MSNIRPYQPQSPFPIEPRHVVCVRPLEQRMPGTETPVHEPVIAGSYWSPQVAQDHAALVLDDFRAKGFTISEIQTEGPVKWEAFRLTSLGNWIRYEVYIATFAF